MNIAVCYLTTFNNTKTFNLIQLYKYISACKKHNIDLYIYINNESLQNNIVVNNELHNITTIYFSYDDLRNQFNYNHYWSNGESSTKRNAGMQIFPLLNLYTTHNNYDYYMFIEDDLLINANNNIFDDITYDFDIMFSAPRKISYEWSWIDKDNNIKTKYLPYTGLLNIYIVKNEILNNFINDVINKGLYAHHEYLFNGYTHYKNYKISYLSDIYNIYCKLSLNEINNNHHYDIIHPIKTIKIYNIFNVNIFNKSNSYAACDDYLSEILNITLTNSIHNILDLGSGRTSILFNTFCNYDKLYCIEDKKEYYNQLLLNYPELKNNLYLCEAIINDNESYYVGLDKIINDTKLDLISIDGPYGYNILNPRKNIINIINNKQLNNNFYIIIHDTDRKGEQTLIKQIFNTLEHNNYQYKYKYLHIKRGAILIYNK